MTFVFHVCNQQRQLTVMNGWTAFLYPQQVKHISIFITCWKIQPVRIFAWKMFLTSERQMLEQTASVRGPTPSNQRSSMPCIQRDFAH